MQLLCLLIIIGATQGDESSESKKLISPDSCNNLVEPNAFEYVSYYALSVQTSFITSVECMRSSHHYIESGFAEIDSSSNDLESNLITKYKDESGSIEKMISGLEQNDVEKETQEKINAVVFMTVYYYQNKDVTVEKSETKLSEVTEEQQAKSILTASRCESSYTNFMDLVTTIKSKYKSETSSTDNNNSKQWDTQVKEYYDAREIVVNKTDVYASIKNAFLFGSGINLCDGSSSGNTDQSILDIYKTDDLSKFFSRTDNDALELLKQTVTLMYSVYKASLTNIYLKSVVKIYTDLALRVVIWEQLNLVRANFEYKSHKLVLFIKTTLSDAESSYGVDSKKYKKITEKLYHCVNKKLLIAVKSTEVHYTKALKFNSDECVLKKDFNSYKVDTIEKCTEDIIKNNSKAAQYDMRNIKKEECSYPSSESCIPKNMYSLEINKKVLQTFICQLNDIYTRMQKTQPDKKSVDYFIYEKITLVQFRNSIRFSKYSATINKMLIINTATFTFHLINADQSTQSADIQLIIDQTTYDVAGTISVNALEITESFKSVEIFVTINFNSKTKSVTNSQQSDTESSTKRRLEYKSHLEYHHNSESSGNNYPSNSGNYPPNPSSDGNQPPSGSNYPTDSGNYPPNPSSDGSQPPSDGGQPPSGSNYPTDSGNYPPNPSSDGNQPPSGSNYPTDSGNYPPNPRSDGSQPPSDGSQPPSDGVQPPSGSNYPTNSGNYPPNVDNPSPSESPHDDGEIDCSCTDY